MTLCVSSGGTAESAVARSARGALPRERTVLKEDRFDRIAQRGARKEATKLKGTKNFGRTKVNQSERAKKSTGEPVFEEREEIFNQP